MWPSPSNEPASSELLFSDEGSIQSDDDDDDFSFFIEENLCCEIKVIPASDFDLEMSIDSYAIDNLAEGGAEIDRSCTRSGWVDVRVSGYNQQVGTYQIEVTCEEDVEIGEQEGDNSFTGDDKADFHGVIQSDDDDDNTSLFIADDLCCEITVTPETGFDVEMSIDSYAIDNLAEGGAEIDRSCTRSGWVDVRVSGYNNQEGSYTLSVSCEEDT